VPRGRLREGASIRQERRQAFLAARRVVSVDEVAERVEREVFRKRHPERQAARLDRTPLADGVEDDAEDRAVQRVESEADRAPMRPPCHRLPEHRNVRVVAAEQPPVERLDQSPGGRGRSAGQGGAELPRRLHGASLTRMPEGDALARAARRLQVLVGERVEVETPHPRAAVKQLAPRLDGRRLEAVEAAGKNLLLRFEGGIVLRSHLRMSGRWRVQARGSQVFGRPWLVLRGAEREAVLWNGPVLELDDGAVRRLGPDILAKPPDLELIVANLRRDSNRELGDALLDQRLVAGIGNVWKAEALWQERVSPWRRVAETSDEEAQAILEAAHELMTGSVEGRRERRAVYRRAGRGCRRCGTPIESRGQGEQNRTAYWCPGCQL
jgi:endonuclease VIII